jgi:hypothetical protein
MRSPTVVSIACLALALCACAHAPRPPAPPPTVAAPAPETPRPRFTVEASRNDTWNAVGQILVRTPGVEYDGRAQMLGLYAIRYRGEPLMVLTQALPLSDAITRTTTEVTVTPRREPSAGYDNAAALFALLERALPAELDSVRARFAAEKQAKEKAKTRKKKKKKKSGK